MDILGFVTSVVQNTWIIKNNAGIMMCMATENIVLVTVNMTLGVDSGRLSMLVSWIRFWVFDRRMPFCLKNYHLIACLPEITAFGRYLGLPSHVFLCEAMKTRQTNTRNFGHQWETPDTHLYPPAVIVGLSNAWHRSENPVLWQVLHHIVSK